MEGFEWHKRDACANAGLQLTLNNQIMCNVHVWNFRVFSSGVFGISLMMK